MSTQPTHRYTLEEYLALERDSEVRYEYWDGEIFAMSGGTLAHDLIMGNASNSLGAQLAGKDCRVDCTLALSDLYSGVEFTLP